MNINTSNTKVTSGEVTLSQCPFCKEPIKGTLVAKIKLSLSSAAISEPTGKVEPEFDVVANAEIERHGVVIRHDCTPTVTATQKPQSTRNIADSEGRVSAGSFVRNEVAVYPNTAQEFGAAVFDTNKLATMMREQAIINIDPATHANTTTAKAQHPSNLKRVRRMNDGK